MDSILRTLAPVVSKETDWKQGDINENKPDVEQKKPDTKTTFCMIHRMKFSIRQSYSDRKIRDGQED